MALNRLHKTNRNAISLSTFLLDGSEARKRGISVRKIHIGLLVLLISLTFSACAYHQHMAYENERGEGLRIELKQLDRQIAQEQAQLSEVNSEIALVRATMPAPPTSSSQPSPSPRGNVALKQLQERKNRLEQNIASLREERRKLALN